LPFLFAIFDYFPRNKAGSLRHAGPDSAASARLDFGTNRGETSQGKNRLATPQFSLIPSSLVQRASF